MLFALLASAFKQTRRFTLERKSKPAATSLRIESAEFLLQVATVVRF